VSAVGTAHGVRLLTRLLLPALQLVHSICLMDPVAMLTCYPQASL
jgi:hypothetical protein